jgi:hypothetical protein
MLLTTNRCGKQDTCAGAGECPACTKCRDKARSLESEFERDLLELGFETNDKNVAPTTHGEFLGLIFDTQSETFSFSKSKAEDFALACAGMIEAGRATRRQVASLTGRLSWWSPAIFNVQLLTRALTCLTAGKEIPGKWDEEVVFEADAMEELLHWRDTIVELSDKPTPMAPPNVEKLTADWARESWFCRLAKFKRVEPSPRLWKKVPPQEVPMEFMGPQNTYHERHEYSHEQLQKLQ